jgi:PTH1 family peptidyl-tRNA hydrolase
MGPVKKVFSSLIGEGKWKDEALLLVQPMTYMNLSGEAVLELVQSREVALDDLLVVCDDLALPSGSVRLRAEGSSGGHHGLESIITRLNSEKFPRLRIGIGPFPPKRDASEFVLDPFQKGEFKKIEGVLGKIPEICQIWLDQGIQKAMSAANSKEFIRER